MTTEPKRPKVEFPVTATTAGEETVALARRHSEITKRLTRKQTVRRIDALKAMAATMAGADAAV